MHDGPGILSLLNLCANPTTNEEHAAVTALMHRTIAEDGITAVARFGDPAAAPTGPHSRAVLRTQSDAGALACR